MDINEFELGKYWSRNMRSLYIGYDGKPVKRTRETHPYSYEPYVVKRYGSNEDIQHTAYSDRMSSWKHNVYHNLYKKHIGSRGFSGANKSQIESFLAEYNQVNEDKLELVVLLEGCNVSNGYPYWFFGWKINE